MTPEEKARKNIDHLLELAGWCVQDLKEYDPNQSLGVAVREFPLSTGEADYALFVDRKAVGVIEAKPEGTTLGDVDSQSGKYAESFPENYPMFTCPCRSCMRAPVSKPSIAAGLYHRTLDLSYLSITPILPGGAGTARVHIG